MSETPKAATSAMHGAIPPRRPPAPPHLDELPPGSGVVHEAGPLVDGIQTCRRCGLALPLPPRGGGFEVGFLIEHVRFENGQRMTSIVGRASEFPDCDAQ